MMDAYDHMNKVKYYKNKIKSGELDVPFDTIAKIPWEYNEDGSVAYYNYFNSNGEKLSKDELISELFSYKEFLVNLLNKTQKKKWIKYCEEEELENQK